MSVCVCVCDVSVCWSHVLNSGSSCFHFLIAGTAGHRTWVCPPWLAKWSGTGSSKLQVGPLAGHGLRLVVPGGCRKGKVAFTQNTHLVLEVWERGCLPVSLDNMLCTIEPLKATNLWLSDFSKKFNICDSMSLLYVFPRSLGWVQLCSGSANYYVFLSSFLLLSELRVTFLFFFKNIRNLVVTLGSFKASWATFNWALCHIQQDTQRIWPLKL